MFSQLSRKIKTSRFSVPIFFFMSLLMLSFGVFSLADDQTVSNKNIFQDTDQDGLSNEEERLYGTDPEKTDTDSDGYTDGTEIKSGYNPLKPAPGDKLVTEQNGSSIDQTSSTTKPSDTQTATKTNLTEELSAKVADTFKDKASQNQELSLDELRNTIQETLNEKVTADSLPEIDKSSIKVKKQKYSQLSEEERAAKLKEDALEYATAVGYILVNNSPVPIHSEDDPQKLYSFVDSQAPSLLIGNNASLLSDLGEKSDSILEQLNGITVPENMIDTHVKALGIMQYASSLQKDFHPNNTADPLANIVVLSKTRGLLNLFTAFSNEMIDALKQNGVSIQEIPF